MASAKDEIPQATRRNVLVLCGPNSHCSDLLESLQNRFEITTVNTVEEALDLLQRRDFDAVLSDTADFLPLERANVSGQATAILNTIGEGVCIVDADGTILWCNSKLAEFGETMQNSAAQKARAAYQYFISCLDSSDKRLRPRKYSAIHERTNRYFEMIATPMLDTQGKLTHVAMVVWEATASRTLQQRIDAIDKAGREIVRLETESFTRLTVEQRITLLQDKIIRYAKRLLKFDHFVVRLLNRRNNQLEVLFGLALPRDEQTEIFANSQNNGITGYVAATGRSYICNNPQSDTHYLPGLDNCRSTLTVPLRLHDQIIGTLNVESDQEAAFNEDDRQMAEIFGRYIAIAMNILDLLVVQRNQTTGQAADNLSHQVSQPLSDIITESSLFMEDYIGHDDIRRRLGNIIDNATKIKKALKDVHTPAKGIFGVRNAETVTVVPELADKRILVVDDEPFIRQTIADVVQKYGCLADIASDGRQAKALLAQCSYDLVVTDIKLPHADGYDVFAAARAAAKDIPVVFMTGFGYDPNHSIVRANREGLTAVLYKPFKVDQLMDIIRQAIGQTDRKSS